MSESDMILRIALAPVLEPIKNERAAIKRIEKWREEHEEEIDSYVKDYVEKLGVPLRDRPQKFEDKKKINRAFYSAWYERILEAAERLRDAGFEKYAKELRAFGWLIEDRDELDCAFRLDDLEKWLDGVLGDRIE